MVASVLLFVRGRRYPHSSAAWTPFLAEHATSFAGPVAFVLAGRIFELSSNLKTRRTNECPVPSPLGTTLVYPTPPAHAMLPWGLAADNPTLAAVAGDPASVLLPEDFWPPRRRPYVRVDASYPRLVVGIT